MQTVILLNASNLLIKIKNKWVGKLTDGCILFTKMPLPHGTEFRTTSASCNGMSYIQPGLITIWFSHTWTIKDSSQKLYVNTQWQCAGGCKYSGLGSSQRNTLQLEYADLCITGISVQMPVVNFLNSCGTFTCYHPQMGFSCTCFHTLYNISTYKFHMAN